MKNIRGVIQPLGVRSTGESGIPGIVYNREFRLPGVGNTDKSGLAGVAYTDMCRFTSVADTRESTKILFSQKLTGVSYTCET